ncbi:MAG: AraC family transcriptional regulator [Dysgonamonadaceae bacterium]|nr:AraC family transcriptional regulator [Dysgonamonadaceae bacterium]
MTQIMNEKLPISEANPIRPRYYDYDHFTYPWHFHSQYELIYVKESTGLCFVGDRIEKYSAGDLIFFGSNLPHYMLSDDSYHAGNRELRVKGTIIQFEKDFMIYSIEHYPQFMQIKTFLEESKRGIFYRKPDCEQIIDLLENFPNFKGFEQIANMLLLLQKMALYSRRQVLASPLYYESFPTLGNKRIEKIISFINGNYTRDINLTEIASMAAMNPSAFCRYFKKSTGKTYIQYVTDIRIGYACKLLVLNKLNISQICSECGFDSVSNFCRIFKQSTGFTPTRYQQNILK